MESQDDLGYYDTQPPIGRRGDGPRPSTPFSMPFPAYIPFGGGFPAQNNQTLLSGVSVPVNAASISSGGAVSAFQRDSPGTEQGLDSDSSEERLIYQSTEGKKTSRKQHASTKKTHDPSLPYEEWLTDDIRKECSKRGLRVTSRMSKTERIEALRRHDAAKKAYTEKLPGDGVEVVIGAGNSVRSKHCMFRLLNILFSDEFALRFSRTGDVASRAELNSKAINDKSAFWQDIRAAFAAEYDGDHERNALEFDDDEFFVGINPAMAKKEHTSKKLFDMWKEVNRNYIDAQAKFSSSGQNENEFRNFVKGRADVLYLRKWLQRKPNLTSFVKGGLLARDEFDTMLLESVAASASAATAMSTNNTVTPTKRKHEALELMASSFHTYVADRRAEANRGLTSETVHAQHRSQLLAMLADIRQQINDVDKNIESCQPLNTTKLQLLEVDREILLEERKKLVERLRKTKV